MQTVIVSLLHQVLYVFIADPVINLLTFTPGAYKAQVAQDAQLVRGGAWAKTALLGKLIYGSFTFEQDCE